MLPPVKNISMSARAILAAYEFDWMLCTGPRRERDNGCYVQMESLVTANRMDLDWEVNTSVTQKHNLPND